MHESVPSPCLQRHFWEFSFLFIRMRPTSSSCSSLETFASKRQGMSYLRCALYTEQATQQQLNPRRVYVMWKEKGGRVGRNEFLFISDLSQNGGDVSGMIKSDLDCCIMAYLYCTSTYCIKLDVWKKKERKTTLHLLRFFSSSFSPPQYRYGSEILLMRYST